MIETAATASEHSNDLVRHYCQGIPALDARLESWMTEVLTSESIHQWIADHGSPLNVIEPDLLKRNIAALNTVAATRDLNFRVYFARKANKCLSLVDAAYEADAGIDIASKVELEQVLQRGVDPARIICTAAIKDTHLLGLCIDAGVTVAIDNDDERQQLLRICTESKSQASVALRLSGFRHEGSKLDSRFGFDVDEVLSVVRTHWIQSDHCPLVVIEGIHFHLDGYSAEQRVSAIRESLTLIDELRRAGHDPKFLDIGGGFPMSYLESAEQWKTFWDQHHLALIDKREPITYRNHGLGFVNIDGRIRGNRNCYPYYQCPVQSDWFARVLDAPFDEGTIAEAIWRRELQLRCEPGRSVLDGCGMTIAKVEYRKQHPNGDWLIGLSMNGTQCRTSSDDFLVDPILVPAASRERERDEGIEGYLVGAYCTESELLTLRKLRFSRGVNIGDLLVFPNTAGYLMHFMESRSHQFPLAKNLVRGDSSSTAVLDPIDQS